MQEAKTPEIPLFPGAGGSSSEVRTSRDNPFYGKALKDAQCTLKLGDLMVGGGSTASVKSEQRYPDLRSIDKRGKRAENESDKSSELMERTASLYQQQQLGGYREP